MLSIACSQDIDFGLIPLQRLELFGMAGQHLGTTLIKFPLDAFDIGAGQLIPHDGDSF